MHLCAVEIPLLRFSKADLNLKTVGISILENKQSEMKFKIFERKKNQR